MSALADLAGVLGSRLQAGPLSSVPPSVVGGAVLAVGVGVGAAILQTTTSGLQGNARRRASDRKRQAKRDKSRRSIENLSARLRESPMSEEDVTRITNLSLQDLIRHIKEGEISPPEALQAYQTKAIAAHARTNCLIEVVKEAERWAKELARGTREGLLYGVPISVKEDIALKGYDSTMGCSEFIDKPAKDDAAIIKVLKRHGAIPFVRTNIPQLCMSFEPGNPIFGNVLNPHNLKHGPGGSSSGEAALIASGASPLGFGSDLAGSVRVPAHFTGLCGFKPTSQRMSNVGCLAGYACYEQNEIAAVFGPLTKDVENLVLAFRALWDGCSPTLNDLDPISLPLTFNEEVYNSSRKLKIGFYTEDGEFPVFPGCARAVLEAKAVLEEMGHEVIPWRVPDMARARELLLTVHQADGGHFLHSLLKYDTTHPNLELLLGEEPSFPRLRRIAATLLRPVMPKYAAQIEAVEGEPDISSYFLLVSELREYIVEVMTEWHRADLDAVICPPFAMPSPPFGNADLCLHSGSYCMAYNALNMPAGVVPVAQVSPADIDHLRDYPSEDPLHVRAKQVMAETLGMPMGVMVVGARYQDEICLRVMKEIQDGIRKTSH